MTKSGQDFGGAWTQQKLDCLEKYLKAYTTIFHANPRAAYFETTYLDAFAGTGYMHAPDLPLLRDMPEYLAGVEEYQKGSVIRALEVQPGFNRYIFIEKDVSRFAELETIKADFPGKEIRLRNEDANSFLKELVPRVRLGEIARSRLSGSIRNKRELECRSGDRKDQRDRSLDSFSPLCRESNAHSGRKAAVKLGEAAR